MANLESWIEFAHENGASDLHLEPGSPIVIRVRGELAPAGDPLSPGPLSEMAKALLGPERWQDFLVQRSADLSQTIAGVRCRINAYHTLRGVSLAIRLLSSFRTTIRDCNLHPDLRRLLEKDTGLLIVAGPTGSGKSTTLAAFIEELNASERRHIITIESPIEYYFKNRKSFIRQREVRRHTPSFEQAIVDSMRQDPDVIVIGEMRTPDVMRLTLNAAETGHLVFSTIHSSTCAEALARLCMSFPSDIQAAICHQVADSLVGVICQRLAYYPQFKVRVPICEVLVATSGVKALVRMGHFSQIITSIQTGGDDGMWSFERYRRWADEKKDWAVPPAKGLTAAQEEIGTVEMPAAPLATSHTVRPEAPPDPERIEISDTGEDRNDLIQQIQQMIKVKKP